jgi:type IV pilus assembly protein PilQ
MSRLSRPLPFLFVVICLAAATLSAQEAGDRAGRHPRAVIVGAHGRLERGLGSSGQGQWRGSPISLSLRDAPLPEVLRAFAQLEGFNLIIDPRVTAGTVTVELKDVPWDLALHVILKTHGLAAEVDGRLWVVAPGEGSL